MVQDGESPTKKAKLDPEVEDVLDEKPEAETEEIAAPYVAHAEIGKFMDDFVPEDVWDPKEGRTIALVAEKGQGKSNLIWALAKESGMDFSEIWVVTQGTDGELLSLCQKPCMVLNNISEAFFRKMIERQQEQTKKKRKSILFVFDDFIGTDFDFQHSMALKQIASRNRHLRINVIFSTQKYKEMPVIYRMNAQWWFFGKNVLSSIEQIITELATVQLEKKRFKALLYKVAAEEKYHFLGLRNIRPSGFVHFRPPHLKPETDDEDSGDESESDNEGLKTEGDRAVKSAKSD